jgi:hypothetical protein
MKRRLHTRGLTMVELVLALGLLSLLLVVVFQLVDRTLSVWRRAETRRSLLEQGSVITDLLAHDLRGIEGGARGDCVIDWVRFDTDGDGIAESKWPRIRLIRQASAREIARNLADERAEKASAEKMPGGAPADDAPLELGKPGLVEALWLIAPASLTDPNARAEGILWRGERRTDDTTSKSFFAPDFFGTSNRPPAGATDEVSGGVLWLGILCATQTTALEDGWKIASTMEGAVPSWDAWSKLRPDEQLHAWNEPATWMPKARDLPLLPRRIQLELELERPVDRLRRTRLVQTLETEAGGFTVDDGDRLPRGSDAFVLIDAEWMSVTSIDGHFASVKRAQRGTTAATHAVGALVHFGQRLVREVPVATYREDWDL